MGVVIDDVGRHAHGTGVNHVVAVLAQADHVIARLEHVRATLGLDARVVVARHVLARKLDREGLGLARLEELGLGKAAQHHGALLNAAGGVRRRIVDLRHVLAGDGARIGDLYVHRDDGPVIPEARDVLLEGRIAEAVAKGVLHGGVIVDEAVSGGRLVVAVAHVDALDVVHVVHVVITG